MSTNMTIFQQQMPARLMSRDAAATAAMNAAAAAGTGGGSNINRISLKQSRFRLIIGGEEAKVLPDLHLDVVIVRGNPGVNKTYYLKPWKPGQEPESPDCMSPDGIRPSAESTAKQSESCATCPQNEWGSKINPLTGKKIKACADGKRIAVLPPGKLDGDMFQITVPPASIGDFGAFLKQLNQISPPVLYNDIVVRISFDTEVSYPKLKFEPVRYLSDEEAAKVQERFESAESKMVCGVEDFAPAAAPAQQAAPVQQAAAPAQQAAAPVQPEAPKATRQRAKPTAPAQSAAAAADDSGFGSSAPAAAAPAQQAQQNTVIDHATQQATNETVVQEGTDIDDVFGGGWDA